MKPIRLIIVSTLVLSAIAPTSVRALNGSALIADGFAIGSAALAKYTMVQIAKLETAPNANDADVKKKKKIYTIAKWASIATSAGATLLTTYLILRGGKPRGVPPAPVVPPAAPHGAMPGRPAQPAPVNPPQRPHGRPFDPHGAHPAEAHAPAIAQEAMAERPAAMMQGAAAQPNPPQQLPVQRPPQPPAPGIIPPIPEPIMAIPAGRTPLHDAVAAGNVILARRLIREGADPNANDAAGHSPWHSANIDEMAELMLEIAVDRAQGRQCPGNCERTITRHPRERLNPQDRELDVPRDQWNVGSMMDCTHFVCTRCKPNFVRCPGAHCHKISRDV